MIYEIKRTKKFRKDVKRMLKQGKNIKPLLEIIEKLQNNKPLPEKNRDHALSGNYNMFRECHIDPDWLLVYRVSASTLILTLISTGSHSDLF